MNKLEPGNWIGYMRYGHCGRFKLDKTLFRGGNVRHYSFWRFGISFNDREKEHYLNRRKGLKCQK